MASNSRAGDVLGADAASEQAVMANAVKAGRQDMDKEAADELVGRKPHDLLPRATFDAVIVVFAAMILSGSAVQSKGFDRWLCSSRKRLMADSVDGASRASGGGFSRRCPMIRTSNI